MTVELRSNDFIALADIALHNPDLQHAVGSGTRGGYQRRAEAMSAISAEHGEFLRQQAAEAKRRALRNLPDLLETAERNLKANGWECRLGRGTRRKQTNWYWISRGTTAWKPPPRARAC